MMEIILRNLNFLAQIAESFVLITVIDSFSCQAELNDVNSAGVWFEHSFGDVRNRTHCNLHRVKAALEIDWNVWNLGPKYVMKTSIDRIFHAESNDVYINRIGTENILGKAKNRTHWHLHTWSSTTPQNVSSRIWKKTCVYMQQSAPFFHLKRMACFSVKMKYLNMSVLTKNGSRCVLLFGQIAVGWLVNVGITWYVTRDLNFSSYRNQIPSIRKLRRLRWIVVFSRFFVFVFSLSSWEGFRCNSRWTFIFSLFHFNFKAINVSVTMLHWFYRDFTCIEVKLVSNW